MEPQGKPVTELGLPIDVLQPYLGSKGVQHILASSSSKQQALKKSLRGHRGSKPGSKYLKTTGEQMLITTNRFRAILSCLACSMANLVSKNSRFFGLFLGRSS